MLNHIIEKISQEFIVEANNSPRLMEDMAAMEKYMAESYGGRTFIELLQNADDAGSKRITLRLVGTDLLFANDGRAFNETDVVSISRSGSSSKRRGVTIGYRGVGFKSTACLTDEIVIFSNGTYFTFSKKICAQALGLSHENVPTIRVPFLVEETRTEETVRNEIQHLVNDGFTTVFVFRAAKQDKILGEIKEITNGHFLFLQNVASAKFDILSLKKSFSIERQKKEKGSVTVIKGDNSERWLTVQEDENNATGIAFKLDEENRIIPCNESDAVFHCYLPTLDKTGYAFKINSDFSTDPSRKHLSADEITSLAIQNSANILFAFIQDVMSQGEESTFNNLFALLVNRTSFSKFNLTFNEEFKGLVTSQSWLRLNDGSAILVVQYKLLPDWIEDSEKSLLRNRSPYVWKRSLADNASEKFHQIDAFLKGYATDKYDVLDFIEILKDKEFVEKANPLTSGKILGHCINTARSKSLISGEKYFLEDCYTLNNGQAVKLCALKADAGAKVDDELKAAVNQMASSSELEWFCKENGQKLKIWGEPKPKQRQLSFSELVNVDHKIATRKWRTAEQQCAEIELGFGNTAKDVSKQNLGYDVESKTPDGEMRYIEVKLLSKTGDSFTMTNNEYTAAHQFGEEYHLCLIVQSDTTLKATYVQNPLDKLQLEKRVRQWEWLCDTYSGEQLTIGLK